MYVRELQLTASDDNVLRRRIGHEMDNVLCVVSMPTGGRIRIELIVSSPSCSAWGRWMTRCTIDN